MAGVPAEGRLAVRWEEVEVLLSDGGTAMLRRSVWSIEEPSAELGGNRMQIMMADNGSQVVEVRRPDVSGVAPSPDGFLATDGTGGIVFSDGTSVCRSPKHALSWDNHAIAIA